KHPACNRCPVANECIAYRRGLVHKLPRPQPRASVTPRHFAAFLVSKRGRFLVRQRSAGQVNAHLWEFPTLELATNGDGLQRAARTLFGNNGLRLRKLCTIRHSITRYRITLQLFVVEGSPHVPLAGKW